ncbi:hypothetical protein AVEN_129617-1 [Araneus ventricosus]|uniref:Uncharacterized protein n=1 Tax=Araneus ventricosus TaxID=182803 RepID=A0A4Y2FLM4_ARAVE|nr:hypothetical protein AVEN_129617-1 [Araneus ventricosus]
MQKTERLKCIFVCLRFPKLERKEEFGEQIIGYGGFQELPPHSPDVTPMDFFQWGYLKHSQFIVKKDRIVRDDGSELVVPRKIWKLTNDAYPSIFPNQPSYLSHEPSTSRKSPSERITALELRDEQNLFTQMCQGNLVNCISNPVQPENKLFFSFDTVHLIKSVRNNWFNEKTLGQVLCFPSPDNSSKISLAKLQDLKDIYETEKSNLIKNAPRLSLKVLYPTSFEKQNVLLALNIFHESNSAALAHEAGEKGKDTMGTKEFIDQFLKWCNIVNVKNSEKGKRLKNPFCDPIRSKDQMSMVFLNKFYDWLVSWNNKSSLPLEKRKELGLPGKGGKLTKETQFALQFTTKSLIDIVNHIFKEHTPEYILLGKFQTDSPEARFGQYRQMSGGNYNVSCLQMFESEKKLKIVDWINFH